MSFAPASAPTVEAAVPAREQAIPIPNARLNAATGAQPVRILHVINDLGIGGAEMMLYRLLAHKDRARFDPIVLSLMDRGSLRTPIEALGVLFTQPRCDPVCRLRCRFGTSFVWCDRSNPI